MDKPELLRYILDQDKRIKKLEADIEEYKSVIDSLKQKLDVSECLYEDSEKENQRLKDLMSEAILIRGPNDEDVIRRWQKALEGKE